MKKTLLYYNTIRHLKLRQILYQIWYPLKWNYFSVKYSSNNDIKFNEKLKGIHFPVLKGLRGYNGNLSFTFLNQTKVFETNVDWNYMEFGKLWNFNLQYMDYLQDDKVAVEERIEILIHLSKQIISKQLKLESYPISLRLINILIFIQTHSIQDETINKAIGIQLSFLENNLEYQILANHLLENYISLCFCYTLIDVQEKQNEYFDLLLKELDEQILSDGAHYERTPSYHGQILIHILQLICLLDTKKQVDDRLGSLRLSCSKMLGWYKLMSLNQMHLPLLNDSSKSNTPAYNKMELLANQCNIKPEDCKLSSSEYRVLKNKDISVIVNCGNICPSYQPGHAHADMLHFVLNYNGVEILVDTGISTYESTTERLLEKSTRMHNTVSLGEENQSQIWSSFRVAKRARIVILEESETKLIAEVKWHNGMKHKRTFKLMDDSLIIEDAVSNLPYKNEMPRANFHFDHLLKEKLHFFVDTVTIDRSDLEMQFSDNIKIKEENYLQAEDFNKQTDAVKLSVYFTDYLKTEFSWKR